jgi:uncharacterized membrane protein
LLIILVALFATIFSVCLLAQQAEADALWQYVEFELFEEGGSIIPSHENSSIIGEGYIGIDVPEGVNVTSILIKVEMRSDIGWDTNVNSGHMTLFQNESRTFQFSISVPLKALAGTYPFEFIGWVEEDVGFASEVLLGEFILEVQRVEVARIWAIYGSYQLYDAGDYVSLAVSVENVGNCNLTIYAEIIEDEHRIFANANILASLPIEADPSVTTISLDPGEMGVFQIIVTLDDDIDGGPPFKEVGELYEIWIGIFNEEDDSQLHKANAGLFISNDRFYELPEFYWGLLLMGVIVVITAVAWRIVKRKRLVREEETEDLADGG